MTTSQTSQLGLILNTRSNGYHERFHEAFGDLPWAIYDCPLTHPRPLSALTPAPDKYDALIFTSQIGVKMFLSEKGWTRKTVYAVGAATAEAARKYYPKVVTTGENGEDMRTYLANAPFTAAFYPSAEDVSIDLAKDFPGRVERVPMYKMESRTDLPAQIVQPLLAGTPVVVPLFSRRNAEILADLLQKAGVSAANARISAVGISADVFAAGGGPWQRQSAADKPTSIALLRATEAAIAGFN